MLHNGPYVDHASVTYIHVLARIFIALLCLHLSKKGLVSTITNIQTDIHDAFNVSFCYDAFHSNGGFHAVKTQHTIVLIFVLILIERSR